MSSEGMQHILTSLHAAVESPQDRVVENFREHITRLFQNTYFVAALVRVEKLHAAELASFFRNDLATTYPFLGDAAPQTFTDLDHNLAQKEYRSDIQGRADHGEGYSANSRDYLSQCLMGFNGWRDFIYDEHGQERHEMIERFGPQFINAAERLSRFFVSMRLDEPRLRTAA
jgi:hypothetical protein